MFVRALVFTLASAAAGGAAWIASQPGHTVAEAPGEVAEVPMAAVLVAAGDIASGEVLSPDKVAWEPWPERNLNDQFITQSARPGAVEELAGTFVSGAFVTGEPIRQARLMQTNANLLSNKIGRGKRAVAVKVSAESTAGGFILPGDRVDVIRTVSVDNRESGITRNDSRIIIANVRVLAVDQTAVQTPEGSVLGKTATLELTPQEAERIMAAEAAGMLSLALRSVADHAETAEVALQPVESTRTVRVRRAAESSVVTVR